MGDEGRGLDAETLGTLSSRRAASRGFSLSTLIPHPSSLIPLPGYFTFPGGSV